MGDVINTVQIKDVQKDLIEMEGFLQVALRDANEELAADLIDDIKSKAPTNSNDTKPDQPDLVESFDKKPDGKFDFTITSNAPHSLALDDPKPMFHTITPDEADALAFTPSSEKIPSYRKNSPGDGWFYDAGTNTVVSYGVGHPGVEGNLYLSRSMQEHRVRARNRDSPINRETIDAIKKSGFKRTR